MAAFKEWFTREGEFGAEHWGEVVLQVLRESQEHLCQRDGYLTLLQCRGHSGLPQKLLRLHEELEKEIFKRVLISGEDDILLYKDQAFHRNRLGKGWEALVELKGRRE